MCRLTHVWESIDFRIGLSILREPTQAVYLPWSDQLVLFFLTTVAVVSLNPAINVSYFGLEGMLEMADDHPVNVRIPRLFAEWTAVAVDAEERLLYVQCNLTMIGDFVPRELGVYRLDVATKKFTSLLLIETERKVMKPALFMAVARDGDGGVNSQKRLFIGVKEVHSVYGRTGIKLNDREMMSLTSIVSCVMFVFLYATKFMCILLFFY